MRLRIPEYLVDFACIGGECPHSCCAGGDLFVDEETYAYYQSVPGPFGRRLRETLKGAQPEEGGGVFGLSDACSYRLKLKGRCPFLGEDSLCDIVKNLGPEALGMVCSEYPRYTLELGASIEKSLTLSCPEVGRLIFTMIRPMGFVETELGGEGGEPGESGDSGEDEAFFRAIGAVRDRAIRILSKRPLPLCERVLCFYLYSRRMQQLLDSCADKEEFLAAFEEAGAPYEAFAAETLGSFPALPEEDSRNFANASGAVPKALAEGFPGFSDRIRILSAVEALKAEKSELLAGLNGLREPKTYEERLQAFLRFRGADSLDDYEFLLCYFTNRYFPGAAYDLRLLAKTRLALFGLYVVRDLDAARYHEGGGSFSFSDRIDTARIYSKEIEHADEVLDFIEGELE